MGLRPSKTCTLPVREWSGAPHCEHGNSRHRCGGVHLDGAIAEVENSGAHSDDAGVLYLRQPLAATAGGSRGGGRIPCPCCCEIWESRHLACRLTPERERCVSSCWGAESTCRGAHTATRPSYPLQRPREIARWRGAKGRRRSDGHEALCSRGGAHGGGARKPVGGGVVGPLGHVGRQADVVVEVEEVGGGAGLWCDSQ